MAEHQQPGQLVERAAARDHGWALADVRVSEIEALRRGGCAFFRASNTSRLDQQPADYAVLPNGALAAGATELLRQCGAGAPATWWAQVIARLGGVPGVLVDEHAPSAIRKIRAAGHAYAAPQLETAAAGTSLTFYTIEYEAGVVHQVQATLPTRGALALKKAQLSPAPDAGRKARATPTRGAR